MALIAPSLLATDFARMGETLRLFKEAGASLVHVDVTDGHFVPDITLGQPVVKSLRKATDLVLDLHLLIERPERYVKEFVEAGADRVAIHAEATPNPHGVVSLIRSEGAKAGLAIHPSTAVESVADLLDGIDYLLILSCDWGLAQTSFLPGTIGKVQTACALRRDKRLDFAIQVEGNIGAEQVSELAVTGADILVAGSDILQRDLKDRLAQSIRQAATSHQVFRI